MQTHSKRGRPSLKAETEVVERIMDLAKAGRSDAEIADIIGITQRTLTNWKTNDFQFLSTFNEARKIADDMVTASLFQKAVGYTHPEEKIFCNDGSVTRVDTLRHYPPDTQAAKFWLINRRPKEWKDRVEVDVLPTGTLRITSGDGKEEDYDV